MKVIASNFIINGGLDEGVQLLCAVGRGADACRSLMAHGRWAQAAWLARVRFFILCVSKLVAEGLTVVVGRG